MESNKVTCLISSIISRLNYHNFMSEIRKNNVGTKLKRRK